MILEHLLRCTPKTPLLTYTFSSLPVTILKHHRNFFRLPSFPNGLGIDPFSTSKSYSEKKIMNYTVSQLYHVVADIDSYVNFVPFCTHSHIIRYFPPDPAKTSHIRMLTAELGVGFHSFSERYVSEVTLEENQSVVAISRDASLFKHLKTQWRFRPYQFGNEGAPNEKTQLEFDIEFQFANPIHAQVGAVFFKQVSEAMVHAFEERCRVVYEGKNERG